MHNCTCIENTKNVFNICVLRRRRGSRKVYSCFGVCLPTRLLVGFFCWGKTLLYIVSSTIQRNSPHIAMSRVSCVSNMADDEEPVYCSRVQV